MPAEIKEIEVVVDYNNIDQEVDKIYDELNTRVSDLETRIKTLRDKENMLDKFIYAADAQLAATDSKNFKLRNQLQITISKQLETQQLIIDTIIKYEKIIQDYMFQKSKLQNDKLSNYLKWKKSTESTADDAEFLNVLKKFENAVNVVNKPTETKAATSKEENELIKSIVHQTFEDGYEL